MMIDWLKNSGIKKSLRNSPVLNYLFEIWNDVMLQLKYQFNKERFQMVKLQLNS